MSTIEQATVYSGIKAQQRGPGDRGDQKFRLDASVAKSVAVGTGDDSADLIFSDARPVASATNDDLDLAGVLLSAFGEAITFAKITAITIKAAAANTTNLTVGNAAANAFAGWFGAGTHTIVLAPGDMVTLYAKAGKAVTAGTGDILRIANAAGATANYTIDILGKSV